MFKDEIVRGPIKVLEAAASNNAYVEGSLARNPDTLAYLALRQLPIANTPNISDNIFSALHAVVPVVV